MRRSTSRNAKETIGKAKEQGATPRVYSSEATMEGKVRACVTMTMELSNAEKITIVAHGIFFQLRSPTLPCWKLFIYAI